jgi:hypothetical protein
MLFCTDCHNYTDLPSFHSTLGNLFRQIIIWPKSTRRLFLGALTIPLALLQKSKKMPTSRKASTMTPYFSRSHAHMQAYIKAMTEYTTTPAACNRVKVVYFRNPHTNLIANIAILILLKTGPCGWENQCPSPFKAK